MSDDDANELSEKERLAVLQTRMEQVEKVSDSEHTLLTTLLPRMEKVEEFLMKINEALWGNGNPASSITDRLSCMEVQQKWINRKLTWSLALGGILLILLLSIAGFKEIAAIIRG
jgi:hypothetical protein